MSWLPKFTTGFILIAVFNFEQNMKSAKNVFSKTKRVLKQNFQISWSFLKKSIEDYCLRRYFKCNLFCSLKFFSFHKYRHEQILALNRTSFHYTKISPIAKTFAIARKRESYNFYPFLSYMANLRCYYLLYFENTILPVHGSSLPVYINIICQFSSLFHTSATPILDRNCTT